MNESILTTVKKLLGIAEEYEHFDADLILHINTFITRLWQIGVGKQGFYIEDKTATWQDLLGDYEIKLQQAKNYIATRVRLVFDPPQNGSASKALEELSKELEWLLMVDASPSLDEVSWGHD